MSKGEVTRQAILDHAASLASKIGLDGLSIGKLAEDLQLSKSGLFAHFRSKEALQIQVLEHAAAQFVEAVVKPALKAPRGEKRVRAVWQHWLRWPKTSGLAGGCFFVAAVTELDDQPGQAREVLVQQQKDWRDVIANVVRTAVSEQHFKKSVDPDQFAFELYGIMVAYHAASRLLKDPRAEDRAEAAFEGLVERSQRVA
jgi:AcrR family transcriptional regulator